MLPPPEVPAAMAIRSLLPPMLVLALGAAVGAADEAPAPAVPPSGAPAVAPTPPPVPLEPPAPGPGVPTGPVYPLAQALVDAHDLNDTSAIAAARLEAALAARRQARSLVLPTLAASGAAGTYDYSTDPGKGRWVRYLGGAGQVSMNLFNAAAYPGLKAATVNVHAQELLSADLRRQLAFQVVASYLASISAEQNLEAAGQILAVTQESLRETQARARVGLNSQNDATRAELDVANAELAQTNAGQALTAARLSLGDLVGHEVTGRLVDPGPAAIPAGGLPAIEALAVHTRPDLQANVLQVAIDEELVRENQNLYFPNLAVIGSYAQDGFRPSRPPGEPYPDWSVALSATWTLWDGGLRQGEIEAAQAQRRQAAALEHAARVDLHRDLATAVSNLATQQAVVRQATVSLKVAQVNANEVRTRYQQGLATQLDVSDANSALFSAQVNLIAAQLQYANARYTLRQLAGWWPLVDQDPTPERIDGHAAAPAGR